MRPSVLALPARRLWAVALVAAALCAVMLDASVAHADNQLTSSTPADGAVVAVSPASLQLVFAQPVTSTNIVAATCNGQVLTLGAPQVSPGNTTLVVPVPTPMPAGDCSVSWSVLGADGGPTTGNFSFKVQASTAVAPTSTTPTGATVPPTTGGSTASTTTTTAADKPSRVGGPLALARIISTLALATLFGSLVLIVVAWPEGVEYILTVRFLRSAWIVAIVGTLAAVIFATAQATGKSIGASVSPSAWLDFADSTPGKALVARLVLSVACGWVVLRPERVIDPATQMPAIAIPGLAIATMGFSRTGGDIALVGIAAGIVHALAMAIWLGGLVLLSRVVLAGPGESDLVHAVRGFERLSMPALIATVASGAVQTYRLDGGSLFSSGHGRVLLLKALAVGAMVFVGLATREFIRTRLSRAEVMSGPLASRLRRALGVEAAIGVVVLALTAWMLALRPPNVEAAGPDLGHYEITRTFPDTGQDFDLTVGLSPGVVGANGVLVDIDAPHEGLTDLRLTFDPPPGSTAASVQLTVPLTGAGVAVLPDAAGIPLEVPGVWTVRVEGSIPSGPVNATTNFTLDPAKPAND